ATRVLLSSLVLLLAFLGTGAGWSVWAQGPTTASITGTVTDEQGAVIDAVAVTVKNVGNNFMRDTKSGVDGDYMLQQLPPGDYDLTVSAEGFTTATSRLNLPLGITTRFDIVMKIGTTADVVEVAPTNLSEEGKTESSTNIDTMRIETLPINRRNF